MLIEKKQIHGGMIEFVWLQRVEGPLKIIQKSIKLGGDLQYEAGIIQI